MVITCSAPGCSTKKDNANAKTTVQFHRFPIKKPDVLAKWVKAMKTPNFKPTFKSYLCSAHFLASDYDTKSSNAGKHLKSNAVPSLFEKKRPGRKKKPCESEMLEDLKEQEDDLIKQEVDVIQEEYLEVSPTEKEESNLAEIIGNQEKETLQILIVGEDGKITNSEYILKKELFPAEDSKDSLNVEATEEFRIQDTDDEDETESQTNLDEIFDEIKNTDSREITLLHYKNLRNREKIRSLEIDLMARKKQVQFLSLKCKKMNKKVFRLKILLKMLVLKRGKGEKNLKQLLEAYGKELETSKDIDLKTKDKCDS